MHPTFLSITFSDKANAYGCEYAFDFISSWGSGRPVATRLGWLTGWLAGGRAGGLAGWRLRTLQAIGVCHGVIAKLGTGTHKVANKLCNRPIASRPCVDQVLELASAMEPTAANDMKSKLYSHCLSFSLLLILIAFHSHSHCFCCDPKL